MLMESSIRKLEISIPFQKIANKFKLTFLMHPVMTKLG